MPSTKRRIATRGANRAWLGILSAWLVFWLTVLFTSRAVAQKPSQGPASQPMKAAEIYQGPLQIIRTFVGTVVPRRVSQVGSPVEGRVIELCVEEGDHVAKGARLAELRTDSLKIDLAAAEAELELLQAELDRLQVAGPEEIKQAEARTAAAEALMDLTESRRKRGANLSTSNVISEAELDELISADDAASSVLKEREIGWELAKVTLPIDIARAEAKKQVQAEKIRRLRDDIAEHTILAPFNGYVSEEYTEVGQWIAKGGLVVEVVEEATEIVEVVEAATKIDLELPVIDVDLPVPEVYVSQLRVRGEEEPGTKALALEIEALPGEPFDGKVVAIVPKADLNARTFPVRVRLWNRRGPNGILPKPGMLARVTLPLGTIPDALIVPKDALVIGRRTTTIWVIRPEADFAAPVSVVIGEATGEWIQVTPDGEALLQPGGLVIREGNERVNPTRPVRVIEEILKYEEEKETSPPGHTDPDR